jgi:hypothetical protein
VFGIGLVLVKPLLCYVLSLLGQRNNLLSSGNLYIFIRSHQEQLRKMQLQVPGRNRICGPAVYSVQLSSSNHKFMYIH